MKARSGSSLLFAAFLLIGLIGAAAYGQSPSASRSGPPRLSSKERSQRLAALPEDERKWLIDYVAPILLPEEQNLFLQLTEPYQREMFKKEFWARRERPGLPAPFGPSYEARYQSFRDAAATQYDGINSDAGRMVIRQGEPASVQDLLECSEVFRQAEIWTYPSATGGSGVVQHIFYRPVFGGPRRLWLPGDSGIFQVASCLTDFDAGCALSSNPNPLSVANPDNCPSGVGPAKCSGICRVAKIADVIKSRGTATEGSLIASAPSVSTEGLEGLWQRLASTTDPKAKPIATTNQGGLVPAANVQTAPAVPAAPSKPMSEADRIKALPDDERKWLTEFVAPIILPQEKKVYLELSEPYQREQFKENFWERREQANLPQPLGPGYRYRYQELRQLADDKYDGWSHDAGRMVLLHGEPAEIFKAQGCGETFHDLEIWTYNNLGNSGRMSSKFLFYRPQPTLPRRLWNVNTRNEEVFLPNSCRKTFDELAYDCQRSPADRCGMCQDNCDVYRAYTDIRARQGSGAGAAVDEAQIFKLPEVPTEGLERMRDKWATTADAKAKKINVEGPGSAPAPGAAPAAGAQAQAAKPSTPAPLRRKLSNKEIKELTAKLEPKYKDFLQVVELIIAHDEREVFLQIADNYQKDRFIDAFWKRRSIDSQGLRTDFRRVYTERVEAAKEQFKNLNNDRAKIFVLNGPPDAVIPIDCDDVFVPIQIWFYERLEALKSKVYLIFYQPMGMGEFKLWQPLDGPNILEVGNVGGLSSIGGRRVDVTRCAEWRTVQQAISYTQAAMGSGPLSMIGFSKLFQPPVVETEGVDQILSMTTDLSAGSSTLGLTKLVRFPEQRANKIGVDLSLLVPKSDLKPRDLGEEHFYNVDVIGEVVKDDRLIDNFKYRFDVPIDEVNADKIPLTVRRYLYPGEYKLILKVSDGNQRAEGRITDALKVPEQPDAPPPAEAAARAQVRGTIEKAKEAGFLPASISLLPVAKEIVTGLQRFETKVATGVKAVDFYLNGSKVMTKTRPPFDADLNMGPLPRKQVIRVVAFGDAGRAVGEDEYIVNEGKEVFRVRILSPEKGARVVGPTKVVAAVAVPEGKTLQKIEFYSNETRVATLYQPPWEQIVPIKDTKSLGYVRTVGTLDDGSVAEDLRYVNAPAYVSEVQVDAVEIYATVTEHNRPVAGLALSNFKVFEDGVIQKVESFEYVKNLPLTLGVMIDTSASMLESLPEAQQAAMQFLDYSLGAKDRAFTISFDNEPYLLTKLTNRKDKIFRSLAGLRAEGSTALYDSIVYGLYQFTGVKGKKALVILTDGKDTASKFDFDTLLEYVRKSGISIYGIGLKISGAELDVKYKLNKLAQVTGGQTFYIDSAKNLEGVYRQINEELRSQYLLTYYSTNAGGKDKWRKVEVKVEPTNLQARTISGYYP